MTSETEPSNDHDAGREQPRVLYVAGSGRNGSTFICQHLNRLRGVFFAGELTHLWDRGFITNELCECGVPFRQCDFWQEVIRSAFGTLDSETVQHFRQLRSRISRFSGLINLRLGRPHVSDSVVGEYGDVYRQLTNAVAKVSGCRIVVDSSKYPTDLAALLRMADLRVSTLHLVRNCHAVVHSWRRKKVRSEIHWKKQLMPRYSVSRTAMAWRIFNQVIEALPRNDLNDSLLRYEDFVVDPTVVLAGIVGLVGLDLQQSNSIQSHSIGGNPCRFTFDPHVVRSDDEWRRKSSWKTKCVIRILCGTLQRKYGYE